MDQGFIEKMLNQGGGWALAALALWLMTGIAKMWVSDIKEGAAREREGRQSLEELHRLTLAHITASTATLSELKTALDKPARPVRRAVKRLLSKGESR